MTTNALLDAQGEPCYLVQVTITSVSPLQCTYLGATVVASAAKWTGCTYTLGPAFAIATAAGKPLVLPNG